MGVAEKFARALLLDPCPLTFQLLPTPVYVCSIPKDEECLMWPDVSWSTQLLENENALPRANGTKPEGFSRPHQESVREECKESFSSLTKELRLLLIENAGVFQRLSVVHHQINTGESAPIRQPPQQLPLAQKEADKAVQDMSSQGLIERFDSPWASPIVLVWEKNGGLRFCVDYRALNNITRKDSYPLPRIDNTLDTLARMNWFSTLDLKSGY